MGDAASRRYLLAVLVVVVCGMVLAVHYPALSAKTLSFDDFQYLTDNELVQNPGWDSVKRFLTEALEPSTVGGYYQPLAMISLMGDWAMGGSSENLMPFHRTSLLLHVANTALVILILYMLFGSTWLAAAVGMLFGLHPMTVEPIPWVGERKTVLATFFALWCLICYIRFARGGGKKFFAGCVVTYVLALMSKPTTTPLPVLMLLMDYWPLRRQIKWRLVWEKASLFVIGAASAAVTVISQGRTASVQLPTEFVFWRVPLILCHNIIFYLYKIIWPVNLSSHYAFPKPFDMSQPMVLAGIIGTVLLVVLLIVSLKWTRGALTGWLFFFLAILPTMQIIGFSNVIASDKFAYLPSLGLLMVLTAFLVWFCGVGSGGKYILRWSAVVIVILSAAGAEAVGTRKYLSKWRETIGFYEYMLSLTPDSMPLNNQLALVLRTQGKYAEAEKYHRRAIECDPNYVPSYQFLGVALHAQGKIDEAIKNYLHVVKYKPEDADIYNYLGMALERQGKVDEAIVNYHRAVEIDPMAEKVFRNYCMALVRQGKVDEIIEICEKTISDKPEFAQGYYYRAIVRQSQERIEEAKSDFQKAIELDPEMVSAYGGLGNLLQLEGDFEGALEYFVKALMIEPEYIPALKSAMRIMIGDPESEYYDEQAAIELAERSARLTNYKNVNILEVVAVAYATVGDFGKAKEYLEKAEEAARAAGNYQLSMAIRTKMKHLYMQKKANEKKEAETDTHEKSE